MTATDVSADVLGIAAALRERLDAVPATQRAWATLWRDERIRPWSTAAADAFAAAPDGPDGTRAHHLAVLHHARAWDAEEAGRSESAVADWDAALGWWSEVHRSDGFWDGLDAELRAAFGDRAGLRDAVDAARRMLPGRLLDVHVGLALRHGGAGRIATGRAHARMVAGSRFPADDVAHARYSLAGGLSVRVQDAADGLRFRSVYEAITARLDVDPGNPWLLEMLLDVTNRWIVHLNAQLGRWAPPVITLLDDVAPRVEPHPPADEPARLLPERARFESWQAFARLVELPEIDDVPTLALARHEAEVRRIVAHAGAAVGFEPTIVADPFYLVGRDLATALVELAAVRRRRGAPDAEVDELLAEARGRYPGVDLGPFREPDDPGPAGAAPEPDVAGADDAADVGELLTRARQCVLHGDGPGAVLALEEACRSTPAPGRLPRIRGTMVAARPLVRGTPPWDARLAELTSRLGTEGGS